MSPTRSRPTRSRPARSWLAAIGLAGGLSFLALAPMGCEKPRDKAQSIVTAGSLIGVTLEEGDKIVGHAHVKHDDYNAYWDMGAGNGIIQVLVRGGKISRVDFEEQFIPRAARDNTVPDQPPATEPSTDPDAPPSGESDAPPVTTGG
jgi:hypothetical protein